MRSTVAVSRDQGVDIVGVLELDVDDVLDEGDVVLVVVDVELGIVVVVVVEVLLVVVVVVALTMR
jgi:hypothetical protein